MKKFQNKYRIPSSRHRTWNYGSNGMYFLTICTKYRKHHFGKITYGKMELNEAGQIAENCWLDLPNHFYYLYLDEFVIMPNHIHGILIIDKPNGNNHWLKIRDLNNDGNSQKSNSELDPVETGHALSLSGTNTNNPDKNSDQPPKSNHPRYRNQGKNTISAMAGSFKSAVTRSARTINPKFEWQRLFDDRIIRTEDDLLRAARYIRNNPAQWDDDCFNK